MHVENFLTYLQAERRYSEHSVRAYARDIEQFSEFLLARAKDGEKEIEFEQVTPDDIRAWIIDLSEIRTLKPASVNRKLSAVRSLFRWLRKEEIVDKDPFLHIGFLKTPKTLPVYVPESKMRRVIDSMKTPVEKEGFITARDRLIVLLLYTTGIRLAELTGIRLDDFQQGFAGLKIRGKGDKERIVPILPAVNRHIERYLQEIRRAEIPNRDGKSLLLTRKGEPIGRNEVARVVSTILGEAGIRGKRSPHVLRHTFATHLLNSGADMREIQELMGHASLKATQIYTHNSITQLKEAYRHAHPRSRKS